VATAAIASGTLVGYLWGLSAEGMANPYYAAAVRSGAISGKAMFFGSMDPGSFITVDKPPAALWLMELSVRLLGFSSWSLLVPQVLCGVGSVLVLHHLVRRWSGDGAAHLAAIALATTPVAALMFRFDNPDALLTLLGLVAALALWKAVESGRTRWLVASAVAVGFGFDTKMLQAFLVVPALAVTYLVAGPPKLGRRLLQLVVALVTVAVASGWWVVVVAVWPAGRRPYIASTDDNSIWSLVGGYNGIGRLVSASSIYNRDAGWGRLVDRANGGQVAWLLPLAGVGTVAGLWLSRRRRRTDLGRAGWVLWGTWAVVCGAVFSFSRGIFHSYYLVQLAPAVAALAGAGTVALWRLGREHRPAILALPLVVAGTAAWQVDLLDRTPWFAGWLPGWVAAGAAIGAAALAVAALVGQRPAGRTAPEAADAGGAPAPPTRPAMRSRLVVGSLAVGSLAVVALVAGPAAYSFTTVAHPRRGGDVAAGPVPAALAGFGRPTGLDGRRAARLVAYLEEHRGSAHDLVAVVGVDDASAIVIASGQPVVPIGGFRGTDPAPTPRRFRAMVADGQVRFLYVPGSGSGRLPRGFGLGMTQAALQALRSLAGPAGEITPWARAHGVVVSSAPRTRRWPGTLIDLVPGPPAARRRP